MIGGMGLGDMKKMITAYKKLHDALKNIIIRSKEEGVVVEISADMRLRNVIIEDESLLNITSKTILEDRIKRAFEKGQQKVQEVAMQKTKEILGFDPNDITSMFGGGAGGMKLPGF